MAFESRAYETPNFFVEAHLPNFPIVAVGRGKHMCVCVCSTNYSICGNAVGHLCNNNKSTSIIIVMCNRGFMQHVVHVHVRR